MSVRLLHKLTTKIVLLTLTSIAIVAGGLATFIRKPATTVSPRPETKTIKIQSSSKSLRLSNAQLLESAGQDVNSLRPLALATADFNEDGMADLIGGYENGGVGMITTYRGNANAIYPRFDTESKSAIFSPVGDHRILPSIPDFIVTGDFDADGHFDVIAAARNSNALYFLAGDGKGGFAEPMGTEVKGAITALGSGEFNRVDGLADFAVAEQTTDGAFIQLFGAADGAWKAQPQTYSLSQPATSLAFAHLTRDAFSDLAIAAGTELVVIAGGRQTPAITRKALSAKADSLAIGHFVDDAQAYPNQIALLTQDGSISVASQMLTGSNRQSVRSRAVEQWQMKQVQKPTENTRSVRQENSVATHLMRARISGNKVDDLVTLQSNQLRFVTNNASKEISSASLEGQGELVAALAMRTNVSALDGLVLLRKNAAAPMVINAVPEATFSVNSNGDLPDAIPGDGICDSSRAGGPICTLRAAIQEANATAGSDTITFNIGGGTQTILLNSPLPDITNPIIIDGTPQGGAPASQSIVINQGANFTGGSYALTLTGNSNTIRGLTISGFTFAGAININIGNSNVIEGNTLVNNGGEGIRIAQSPNNIIGGTTAAARNIISGNSFSGIFLFLETSSGNRILGNYIGTNSAGTSANGNGTGVNLFLAANNVIGSTTAGARNVISGNFGNGISISGSVPTRTEATPEAADGNVIQSNYIGVDAAGTGALGNGNSETFTAAGIQLDGVANTTIGGTAPGAGNIIANNATQGVYLPAPFISSSTVNNSILNNSIYNNRQLGIDLGAAGVTANDTNDTDTGANNLQNYPVLTSALTRTTGTTIVGTLNSAANSTYIVEVFSNASCDTTGNGEGEVFVGRTNVTTNASGVGSISLVVTTPVTAGRVLTATATDSAGNTSEFSACLTVQNAVADLGVTVTAAPNPVFVGNNLTYTITVANNGPNDATGVALTDNVTIPNGQFTVVSITPSAGSCTGTGPINCNLGTIAPSANATVSVVIAPTIPTTGTPPQSVTATNTASVSSNEQDTITTNNIGTANATVNASANLAITQSVSPNPVASAATVTYTINVTNNGPSTASFVSAVIRPPVQLLGATCTAPAGWSCGRDGNPFFASTSNLAPGTAVLTITGTLACLAQNTTLTSDATVSSQTFDVSSANNSSTITSTGLAGTAVGTVAYDAGGTALQLGPIVAGSTATPPSGTFTLTNTGCLPMNLTTALFVRVTNAANLSGVDDSRYFSLRLVPASGAEVPLNPTVNPDRTAAQPISINRTLLSGEQLRFRILFNPPLPTFAGTFANRDQGVFATQVLPALFDSQIRFNFITGGVSPGRPEAAGDPGTAAANISARVSPAIQIVPRDGNVIGNPATTPLVEMTTVRDDFRVKVSLYDANKNATKITYQFFDTFRQPASRVIEVDLTSVLNSLSTLLPGQPFTLQQDFSGASGRPDITYVRVAVTDGDATTVTASSSPFIPAFNSATTLFRTEALFSDVIQLAPHKLESKGEASARREN